jgi:hypothetical protein
MKMAKETDPNLFSPSTKEIIATQAGFICAFPACGVLTSGPSEEGTNSVARTGMACHISSRKPGGKRWDASMKPIQRRSTDNGIWMCYKHGKLIDADEARFTTEILHKWKELSVKVVKLMHETGVEYSHALNLAKNANLTRQELVFGKTLVDENLLIGNALHDSFVPIAWGKDLNNSIRDFLIENARNAVMHGGATEVRIIIDGNNIEMIDDGSLFSVRGLATSASKNGGAMAVRHLLNKHEENIIFSSYRKSKYNHVVISLIQQLDDVEKITPCTITVSRTQFKKGVPKYELEETCNELYVLLPKFLTRSDFGHYSNIDYLKKEKRQIIFISEQLSTGMVEQIQDLYPGSKVVNL